MIKQIHQSISHLLIQLENAVQELSDQQFSEPIPILGDSTIGQHLRHTLEFYNELDDAYQSGMINYDQRKRDHNLQTCRETAIAKIRQIRSNLNWENKELKIRVEYDDVDITQQQIQTNYFRELVYNLEHTIHHMALIKVGVSISSRIILPEDFGVAASTIK